MCEKVSGIHQYVNTYWDLIVIGGGMSGVAAAVSARRMGLNVLLLEKGGSLGGAAVNMLVSPFMSYSTEKDGHMVILSQGFFTELRKIMSEIGAYDTTVSEDIHEEYLKIALDRLMIREDIKVLYHSYFCGVEKNETSIHAVKVATKAGILSFSAHYFIDCSGDADVAAAAGCPFRLGREDNLCQPMTLCFRIGNIDIEKFNRSHALMQKLYKKFQKEGKIKNTHEFVLYFTTRVDHMLHFNTTRVIKHNPVDPLEITEAEMIAREQMLEMYNFLHENIPGCENAQLLYSAGEIGVRESRMIIGEHVLTEEELKACTKFDDAICAAHYAIDIHNPEGSGTMIYSFKKGTWYTIPYRSLVPKCIDNLLVAGRSISVTHVAQGSVRIMPTAVTLGEAAGVAAGVVSKTGCAFRDADVKAIQNILRKNGAFTGIDA